MEDVRVGREHPRERDEPRVHEHDAEPVRVDGCAREDRVPEVRERGRGSGDVREPQGELRTDDGDRGDEGQGDQDEGQRAHGPLRIAHAGDDEDLGRHEDEGREPDEEAEERERDEGGPPQGQDHRERAHDDGEATRREEGDELEREVRAEVLPGTQLRGHEEVELGDVRRHPGAQGVQEGEGEHPGEGQAQDRDRGVGRGPLEGRAEGDPRADPRGDEQEHEAQVDERAVAPAEARSEEEPELVREHGPRAGHGATTSGTIRAVAGPPAPTTRPLP